MNILHTEKLTGWGGQQNKDIKEMLALREFGHEVYLICSPGSKISKRAKELNIQIFEINMEKYNHFITIPKLLHIIRKYSIDVVITHGSTDSWTGGLAGRISLRSPVLIRERHNLFPIRGCVSRWLHTTLFHYIFSVSDAVTDYLLEIGVKRKKIFQLPSSVDVVKFKSKKSTLRKEFNIPDNAVVVGIFTTLEKKKGLYDFFEASKLLLKKYRNLYLVYGGEYGGANSPEEKDRINAEYKKEGFDLDRIIWTGRRYDPENVMKGFDIFLFPSHSEGLGTVILEGMASKLPVITWDKKPMSELAQYGVNGFTAEFGNIKKMAAEVEKLIVDPELRKKMGAESLKIAEENFTDECLKANLKKYLSEITKKRSK